MCNFTRFNYAYSAVIKTIHGRWEQSGIMRVSYGHRGTSWQTSADCVQGGIVVALISDLDNSNPVWWNPYFQTMTPFNCVIYRLLLYLKGGIPSLVNALNIGFSCHNTIILHVSKFVMLIHFVFRGNGEIIPFHIWYESGHKGGAVSS